MSRCILTSVKISRIFKHFFIDFLKFTFVTVDMKRTVLNGDVVENAAEILLSSIYVICVLMCNVYK